jgi:starch synthase
MYLRYVSGAKAKSVITIHNLGYQGVFPAETTTRLGLPPQALSIEGVEYYGRMSFLKGGLQAADRITTVSPSYAEEIQREPMGMGLNGLLSYRRDVLAGILNGIDTDAWDPDNDPYIERYYNATRLAFKEDNRRALRARMRLRDEAEVPLFATVGRMTPQKGLDVLADIAAELIQLPAQLAVLGSGDAQLQTRFQSLARAHPGRVAVQIGFDEGLSHQIEAGADVFMMPSRYEPSGLNQMYSQRYGTPPVVHATGGLKDSVVNTTAATLADRTATGFAFSPLSPETMLAACRRAAESYRNKRVWRQIQKNGMARDFSWESSARRYHELYRDLVG